jgi:hypothetical protein
VILGNDDIIDGTEDNLSYATEHMFSVYGKTKQQAEQLILKANGTACSNITFHSFL